MADPITTTTAGEMSGAGSYAEFELDPTGNPDVYTIICFDELPEISEPAETIEVTQVCDKVKRYVSGVSDTSDITLTTNVDSGNADKAALKALALAKTVVKTRFVYANGDTAEFDLQLLNYGKNAATSEVLKEAFMGKITGATTFGTVA